MRRGRSASAVLVLLVVLSAWTVATMPGPAAAAPDGSAEVDVDDSPAERFSRYEELTTIAPSVVGAGSPSEEATEDPEPGFRLHSWRCPVCGETKRSLAIQRGDPLEAAANNLRSHLRNTDGAGHGRVGQLPSDLDDGTVERNVYVCSPPGTT